MDIKLKFHSLQYKFQTFLQLYLKKTKNKNLIQLIIICNDAYSYNKKLILYLPIIKTYLTSLKVITLSFRAVGVKLVTYWDIVSDKWSVLSY